MKTFLNLLHLSIALIALIFMQHFANAAPSSARQLEQQPQLTKSVVVNGIDTSVLMELVDSIKLDPTTANITLESRSKWQDGFRVYTKFGPVDNPRPFILGTDHGAFLGGTGSAPVGIESLLSALGSCIVAASNAKAALLGVTLDQLQIVVEADVDVLGTAGVSPEISPALKEIRLTANIEGQTDVGTLNEILEYGFKHSPVSDSLRNGVVEKPIITVKSNQAAATQLAAADQQVLDPVIEINGVKVARLKGFVTKLASESIGSIFTHKVVVDHQDGMRSFASTQEYKLDGQAMAPQDRHFILLGDEPIMLAGTDAGPAAGETLLHAMGSDIASRAIGEAVILGVNITKLTVDLEADLNLKGLLALDPDIRPGMQVIRTKVHIEGDADEETLEQIAKIGCMKSMVAETVRKSVPVKLNILTVSD